MVMIKTSTPKLPAAQVQTAACSQATASLWAWFQFSLWQVVGKQGLQWAPGLSHRAGLGRLEGIDGISSLSGHKEGILLRPIFNIIPSPDLFLLLSEESRALCQGQTGQSPSPRGAPGELTVGSWQQAGDTCMVVTIHTLVRRATQWRHRGTSA